MSGDMTKQLLGLECPHCGSRHQGNDGSWARDGGECHDCGEILWGRRYRYDDAAFSGEAAVLAYIAAEQGWSKAVASEEFATGDGNTYAFCAYETQAECDEDEEGAYAPRVEVIS
jgi:hypothetical protein